MAKVRYAGLDTLRGVTLVSMMAYHACWDLVYIFGMDWAWYSSFGAYLWQQSICWTFILLSGYCWALGRRQLRRGCTVFLGGVLISAVTYLLMPDSRIFFGVLSLLGSAMLLTVPLSRWLRRVPAGLGCGLSFLLFCLLRRVGSGTACFGLITLPESWYHGLLTACLGFPPAFFYSADYFPLLPWLFLFWTGYYLYRLFPHGPERQLRLPLVTAMGRHSLPIYLLHQPVVYGLLYALRLLGLL